MTDTAPEPTTDESPMVVFPCAKCRRDMPPMSASLAAEATKLGAVIQHDVCPGEEKAAAPEGRYFEVRVQVVEVVEHDEGDGDTGERETRVEVRPFFRFERGIRAANLDAAMRPLALALGERWADAEKHARIADSDPS